jgi:hypothetical protein
MVHHFNYTGAERSSTLMTAGSVALGIIAIGAAFFTGGASIAAGAGILASLSGAGAAVATTASSSALVHSTQRGTMARRQALRELGSSLGQDALMLATMGAVGGSSLLGNVTNDTGSSITNSILHGTSKLGGLITTGQTIYGGVREGQGIANGSIQLKGKNNWQNDLNLFSTVGGGAMMAGHLTMAYGSGRPIRRIVQNAGVADPDDLDNPNADSVRSLQEGRGRLNNFDRNYGAAAEYLFRPGGGHDTVLSLTAGGRNRILGLGFDYYGNGLFNGNDLRDSDQVGIRGWFNYNRTINTVIGINTAMNAGAFAYNNSQVSNTTSQVMAQQQAAVAAASSSGMTSGTSSSSGMVSGTSSSSGGGNSGTSSAMASTSSMLMAAPVGISAAY